MDNTTAASCGGGQPYCGMQTRATGTRTVGATRRYIGGPSRCICSGSLWGFPDRPRRRKPPRTRPRNAGRLSRCTVCLGIIGQLGLAQIVELGFLCQALVNCSHTPASVCAPRPSVSPPQMVSDHAAALSQSPGRAGQSVSGLHTYGEPGCMGARARRVVLVDWRERRKQASTTKAGPHDDMTHERGGSLGKRRKSTAYADA